MATPLGVTMLASPSTTLLLPWLAADGGSGTPVALLWAAQAVSLLVGLASGWFALRTKRTEATDSRQARFDARVDRELDEALEANAALRRDLKDAQRQAARYEAYLHWHGIDPATGRTTSPEPPPA